MQVDPSLSSHVARVLQGSPHISFEEMLEAWSAFTGVLATTDQTSVREGFDR